MSLNAVLFFALSASQVVDNLDPAFSADLTLTPVLDGFSAPTSARWLPDGRLVIAEQLGQVYVWTGTGTPMLAGTLPVAQTLGETGLLGMAVDPQFGASHRLYFYYSVLDGATRDRHRIAWARLDPLTNQLDVAGATDILTNLLGSGNHNGGGLEFGPDGYLYAGVGDKGCNCGCDPGTNANNFFPTCLTNRQGKILRIGRDGEIPPSNPLVGTSSVVACGPGASCTDAAIAPDLSVTGPPREEIYVWGLRNPWRFSFDSQTGYLWIGDVGELSYEEITISKQGGEHHGWPYREGAHGQPIAVCQTATPNAIGPCVDPVYEYHHDETPNFSAGSVTGGVFSNHCSWPAPYFGKYWFSDYTKLRVWMLEVNAARDGVVGDRAIVVRQVGGVAHLFTGNDGAIYYVSNNEGEIWRIGPASPAACAKDAGVEDAEPADAGGAQVDVGSIDAEPVGAEPVDAGAGAIDAGAGAIDAGALDAASSDAGAAGTGKSSCGCASTRAHRGEHGSLAALLFALLVARRLRRSSARTVRPGCSPNAPR